MSRKAEVSSVSIRPGVTILSVLRHLNYKPWYALAEFVDNAVASFLANRTQLRRVGVTKLLVTVDVDPDDGGKIVIRDNAAGIAGADYARAFKPAEVPPDRTGLSEFGMGMKSAACWFAREWTVKTSAIGEEVMRSITFHVDEIVKKRIEELRPVVDGAKKNEHFTEVVLTALHRPPQGRTIGKMREHLASIYRVFLRDGVMELTFNDEPLAYEEPAVLSAPFYKKPKGAKKTWRKRVDIKLGPKLRAKGWAAIREKGSTADSGFGLFRRGRLIQGSGDEGYRPEAIFGRSNSFIYQRVFGELHLDGFDVSHTKDGIRWEEHEDAFIERLREALDAEPLPLLQQSLHHRARPRDKEIKAAADKAVSQTSEAIREHASPVLERQVVAKPDAAPTQSDLSKAVALVQRTIEMELHGAKWRVVIEATTDESVDAWLDVADKKTKAEKRAERDVRAIGMRVSLAHPFMERFANNDPECLEALVRVGAALALAETAAKDSGVKGARDVRMNLNELLRKVLSGPVKEIER